MYAISGIVYISGITLLPVLHVGIHTIQVVNFEGFRFCGFRGCLLSKNEP